MCSNLQLRWDTDTDIKYVNEHMDLKMIIMSYKISRGKYNTICIQNKKYSLIISIYQLFMGFANLETWKMKQNSYNKFLKEKIQKNSFTVELHLHKM